MMIFTPLIDAGSLARLLRDAGNSPGRAPLVLLDCRFDLAAPAAGRQAYAAAHIPGARYVDLERDLSGPVGAGSGRHPLPSPDVLAERFAALGIGNHTPVVAYDDANGSFAARAWWLLRWLGAGRVAVLDGGFKAWLAGGGEVATGEPRGDPDGLPSGGRHSPPSGNPHGAPRPASVTSRVLFTPHVDASAVATSADVVQAMRDPARVLVDARAAERFAGSIEPIDPVAGHIPGAVNFPFANNLGPEGRFLAPAELRRRWQERLAGAAPHDAILMCGSGVTACHNLLAMELAGLPGAKLYAGSWSEWIRNPEHPVARGTSQ